MEKRDEKERKIMTRKRKWRRGTRRKGRYWLKRGNGEEGGEGKEDDDEKEEMEKRDEKERKIMAKKRKWRRGRRRKGR